MLDQVEIYRLFAAIDRHPEIMRPSIGNWCAWPAAKMQLLWHLMHSAVPATERKKSSLSKIWGRLPHVLPDLLRTNMPTGVKYVGGARVGMLYVPMPRRFSGQHARDYVFGDLLTETCSGMSVTAMAYRRYFVFVNDVIPGVTPFQLGPYYRVAEQLALLLMATSRIRRVAGAVDEIVTGFDMPLPPHTRQKKILLALALFESQRRIFKKLFRQLKLDVLVLTYAPGRSGEIAAARELDIPVIELQHGVISARCPDYTWPRQVVSFKDRMAIPNHMALYGPRFRDLALSSDFWSPSEVSATGSAAIDAMRTATASTAEAIRKPGPLRLVFMTQATNRPAAISFWHEVLRNEEYRARQYRVQFKIHPEELAFGDDYRALTKIAPDVFSIASSDVNPIEAMLDADVVVSYNSMALIEALAVGRPAISLCGGTIPKGFSGSFDINDIVGVLPHVDSPSALCRTLHTLGDENTPDLIQKMRSVGRSFFSEGFVTNTTALINQLAERKIAARIIMAQAG